MKVHPPLVHKIHLVHLHLFETDTQHALCFDNKQSKLILRLKYVDPSRTPAVVELSRLFRQLNANTMFLRNLVMSKEKMNTNFPNKGTNLLRGDL